MLKPFLPPSKLNEGMAIFPLFQSSTVRISAEAPTIIRLSWFLSVPAGSGVASFLHAVGNHNGHP